MILICDQSLNRFGYCLIEPDLSSQQFKLIQYGYIQMDKRKDYYQRILSIEQLFAYFRENWDIRTIVTEQVFLHANPTTYMKLASLLFYIRYYCTTHSIEFVTPLYVANYRNKWAKSHFGIEHVDKQSLFQWIKTYVNGSGLFVHDTSDAILMGLFYCIKALGLSQGNLHEGALVNLNMRKLESSWLEHRPL